MIDPAPRWACLATDVRFSSEWFEVRRDDVVRPDGSRSVYDHVVVPGAVTVLALREDGEAAVTRQWIYVHEESQWRLPAGGLKPEDADPHAAAARELAEETGLRARHWTPLGSIHCADSFTNHRDHAFLATGLTTGPTELDPGEADLELHWFPFDRLLAMVLDGQLPHAGSTFAVLSAKARDLAG